MMGFVEHHYPDFINKFRDDPIASTSTGGYTHFMWQPETMRVYECAIAYDTTKRQWVLNISMNTDELTVAYP
jgi:hypothetical protein